jgi:hypothetical protein
MSLKGIPYNPYKSDQGEESAALLIHVFIYAVLSPEIVFARICSIHAKESKLIKE